MVAPAAGYFRVSKHRDGSRASDVYRAQIQRYCEYRDLELSAIYSDIDYSGYHHSERRPGLLQLCEDRHHFSTVVVPKLSRLGRSLKHLCHLFETFETDSIDLVFLDVGVDTGTSQGRLLRNVLAAFAEFESDVKSDYGRANAAFKALGGLPHGKAPYGYRQAPGTGDFVPHAQRALIVQEIFRRYVGGEGTCSIARRLDRRGLTTSRGARWHPDAIRKILDNPVHAGYRRHKGQLYDAAWEALIDRDSWDETRRRREMARIKANRNHTRAAPRLLTGLLACGKCGRLMHFHRSNRTGRAALYECVGAAGSSSYFHDPCNGGGIDASRAEELVVKEVMASAPAILQPKVARVYRRLTERDWWGDASTDARRELLAAVLERVELVPLPDGTSRGRNVPKGRALGLKWRREFARSTGEGEGIVSVTPHPNARSKACAECGVRRLLIDFPHNSHHENFRGPICLRCRKRPERSTPAPAEKPIPVLEPEKLPWNEFRKLMLISRTRT